MKSIYGAETIDRSTQEALDAADNSFFKGGFGTTTNSIFNSKFSVAGGAADQSYFGGPFDGNTT